MRQRSLICLCSIVALFFFSTGDALVTETNDFAHAFTYLEEDTLYVFDLDNTIIETAQHLGSDQWVTYKLDHLTKQGLSLDDALNHVIPCWLEVQNRTEMKLVDPAIPDLLYKMQKKHVTMIGLTKRPPQLANRTLEQLKPLNVDFSKTAHMQEEVVFEDLKGTAFKQGIIFVAQGIDKGPSLLAYLKKLKKMPKRIVVIDDKMSHVKNIASAVEPLGINFVGIRYGKADEKVNAFNPKIAELQMEHFKGILSDEQALHLLKMEGHSAATGE
ncbi:MAG: DUF2608 domain-containing protein [Verrucomicrobia bacterium]|nr:DUF2608 domain-containing protein [Verrucomicrobiota bacterium]